MNPECTGIYGQFDISMGIRLPPLEQIPGSIYVRFFKGAPNLDNGLTLCHPVACGISY